MTMKTPFNKIIRHFKRMYPNCRKCAHNENAWACSMCSFGSEYKEQPAKEEV